MDEVMRKKNNAILDFAMKKLGLRNDAQLSRTLDTHPPVISRIRHGKLGVSPSLMIRIHETTETSFAELRGLMAAAAYEPAQTETASAA